MNKNMWYQFRMVEHLAAIIRDATDSMFLAISTAALILEWLSKNSAISLFG